MVDSIFAEQANREYEVGIDQRLVTELVCKTQLTAGALNSPMKFEFNLRNMIQCANEVAIILSKIRSRTTMNRENRDTAFLRDDFQRIALKGPEAHVLRCKR